MGTSKNFSSSAAAAPRSRRAGGRAGPQPQASFKKNIFPSYRGV